MVMKVLQVGLWLAFLQSVANAAAITCREDTSVAAEPGANGRCDCRDGWTGPECAVRPHENDIWYTETLLDPGQGVMCGRSEITISVKLRRPPTRQKLGHESRPRGEDGLCVKLMHWIFLQVCTSDDACVTSSRAARFAGSAPICERSPLFAKDMYSCECRKPPYNHFQSFINPHSRLRVCEDNNLFQIDVRGCPALPQPSPFQSYTQSSSEMHGYTEMNLPEHPALGLTRESCCPLFL